MVEIDRQHRMILGFEFFDDLRWQVGAGLEQVGDNTVNLQVFVVIFADFLKDPENVVQGLA